MPSVHKIFSLNINAKKRYFMKTKNECYTYFRISGDFDPDTISEMLGILPDRSWKIYGYSSDFPGL